MDVEEILDDCLECEELAQRIHELEQMVDFGVESLEEAATKHLRNMWWMAELETALKMQAANYHLVKSGEQDDLCWCRFLDGTINPRCQNQTQCVRARKALAREI